MSYGLGVDLGTTFTAAALARDGRVEMATLGDHTDAIPSVVLIRADGTVLTGDAAERRAGAEPDRVAREVKRRLGDPLPLILGGAPHPATELIAHQLRAVVAAVSQRQGAAPDTVTLTHPANWGPYKRELFGQIPGLAGLDAVHTVTEPEAAAAHYAHNNHLGEGALVAVYDLGGGTFDATVLRTTRHGFEILGRPEGVEGLGGVDFDEAVLSHVDRTLDGAVSRLDPADPRATSAAIRLRHDCVKAKEALSADTETTIPVLLPELQTEVRLTRGEFETMIRPPIETTIAALRRALRSARVDPAQLATVLLVGGSSRIPLVAHLVSAELGRPTAVDAHPKHATVLGAAALLPPSDFTSPPDEVPSTAPPAATAGVHGAMGPATAQSDRSEAANPPDPAPTAGTVPAHAAGAAASVPPADSLAAADVATPAAGIAAPALAAGTSSRLRFLRHRSSDRDTAATQPHGPDSEQGRYDGQGPPTITDTGRPHRRRLPLTIGIVVLLAALAVGGTFVYRASSAQTPPPGTNIPVAPAATSQPASPPTPYYPSSGGGAGTDTGSGSGSGTGSESGSGSGTGSATGTGTGAGTGTGHGTATPTTTTTTTTQITTTPPSKPKAAGGGTNGNTGDTNGSTGTGNGNTSGNAGH